MDFDTYWFVYLIAAFINGIIWASVCKSIIASKGYGESEQSSYAWVGFLLGLIGVLIAAVKPQNTQSVETSPASVSNTVDLVWKCNFCGNQNIGRESYSECYSCGHTRGESSRKKPKDSGDMIDNLDALKKLKELLDMGAITQDEFDLKKSKLLK